MTSTEPPQLVTIAQAAKYLAVCEATVKKWIYNGELASIKAGKMRRITVDELNRWVERHTT